MAAEGRAVTGESTRPFAGTEERRAAVRVTEDRIIVDGGRG